MLTEPAGPRSPQVFLRGRQAHGPLSFGDTGWPSPWPVLCVPLSVWPEKLRKIAEAGTQPCPFSGGDLGYNGRDPVRRSSGQMERD